MSSSGYTPAVRGAYCYVFDTMFCIITLHVAGVHNTNPCSFREVEIPDNHSIIVKNYNFSGDLFFMADIICPNCKSKDTEFDDLVTTETGQMIAKCHCNACAHKWDSPFGL